MNKEVIIGFAVYIAAVSVISVILTAVDKINAVKHKQRVPEKTLMLFGLFGGAFAMYITMKTIRHKTLHKKFMVGLPLEIIFHISLICFLYIRFVR